MNRDQKTQPKHHSSVPVVSESDVEFFADHPDRNYRIRLSVGDEYDAEFNSLGGHERERRRVIVSRVPVTTLWMFGVELMSIPLLAFADEEIADRDDVLGPIFRGIMEQAGADMGLHGKPRGW